MRWASDIIILSLAQRLFAQTPIELLQLLGELLTQQSNLTNLLVDESYKLIPAKSFNHLTKLEILELRNVDEDNKERLNDDLENRENLVVIYN